MNKWVREIRLQTVDGFLDFLKEHYPSMVMGFDFDRYNSLLKSYIDHFDEIFPDKKMDWKEQSARYMWEALSLLQEGKKVRIKDRRYQFQNGASKKIEYVYCNEQMNRMFAHIIGCNEDKDYDLGIIDLWSCYAGEWTPPEYIRFDFYKRPEKNSLLGQRLFKREDAMSSDMTKQDVINYLLRADNEYTDYKAVSDFVIITFPDGDTAMLDLRYSK